VQINEVVFAEHYDMLVRRVDDDLPRTRLPALSSDIAGGGSGGSGVESSVIAVRTGGSDYRCCCCWRMKTDGVARR